jgi:hypothetical protein
MRRTTPPASLGNAEYAGIAPLARSASPPPRIAVDPSGATAVVASTTFPARRTARTSRSSCAGLPLGSVNCTS